MEGPARGFSLEALFSGERALGVFVFDEVSFGGDAVEGLLLAGVSLWGGGYGFIWLILGGGRRQYRYMHI